MEKAKEIKITKGRYKGLEELLQLHGEIRSQVAESFGDLFLGDNAYKLAIAAYVIANKPEKLVHLGDILFEEGKKLNEKSDAYFSREGPNSREGLTALFDYMSLYTTAFMAYSLAKTHLDVLRKKRYEQLIADFKSISEELPIYEKLKADDIKTFLDSL